MGYYTRYTLKWWTPGKAIAKPCPHCGGTGTIEIADAIEEAVANDPACESHTQTIASQIDDQTKWYEHEEDMKLFSLRFPDALFTLRGEGEEAGDVWVKYFKNGKMQVEKVSIDLPGFDEGKLQ